jgi:hypothetical protein
VKPDRLRCARRTNAGVKTFCRIAETFSPRASYTDHGLAIAWLDSVFDARRASRRMGLGKRHTHTL